MSITICVRALLSAISFDISFCEARFHRIPIILTNFVLRDHHQKMPYTFSSCSNCGRLLQVRHDGNIRIHSPIPSRCPGSGLPPVVVDAIQRPVSQSQRSPSPSVSPVVPSLNQSQPPPSPLQNAVLNPGPVNCKILKRIPRGSRAPCVKAFTTILNDIVRENKDAAWECLFLFSRRCLSQPIRGGQRRSLATHVNRAIEQESDPAISHGPKSGKRPTLAKMVAAKLEDGDFRGAVRLVSSSELIRPADRESLKLLQEKHPPAHVDCSFPPLDSTTPPPVVSPGDVTKAIFSFPTGSAGGPDGCSLSISRT